MRNFFAGRRVMRRLDVGRIQRPFFRVVARALSDVGNERHDQKTDISEAGIVSTYFQLASQIKCMKNEITSIAFVHETAIMNTQPTAGVSWNGQNRE